MHERMWRRGPDGEILRVEPRPAPPEDAEPASRGDVRPRASAGLALRLGFRDSYDFLGSVLVLSIAWVVIAATAAAGGQFLVRRLTGGLPGMLPALLSVFGALVGLVFVGGPLTGGLCRFCRNAAARAEPELFDLSWGFRSGLGRSLRLAGIQAAMTVLLATNCYWYVFEHRSPVLTVVGAFFGYLLAFWGLASLYQWPLLSELDDPPLLVVKKSALLVLDNFGFSLAVGAVCLVLTVVMWASAVGGVLLWAGAMGMIQTQAVRELLRRYGLLPPDPTLDPIAGETHDLRGHGWHE
jgi:hypothetical protein